MDLQIERKNREDIYQTPVIQQSPFWAEVKERQGIGSDAFDVKVKADELYPGKKSSSTVEDDFLVLYQPIGDGFKVAYLPYGPTLTPSEDRQGEFLEELSESMRPFLDEKTVMVRYDLLWESFWAQDEAYHNEKNVYEGPPPRENQEIRLNFNTHNWNLRKSNTNVLPSDTIFIDLKKDPESLLMAMKPKTRYNIRLAQRKGVRIRTANPDEIAIWYQLYEETCARNRIFLNDIHYFRDVMGITPSVAKFHVDLELLIAEVDQRPLAAMFLVYSGNRASYLYGASSATMRNYMATYALQWEAIRRAQQRGCTEYDMFGVAPRPDPSHPMYGLYKFKSGFGGEMFHRLGCWEYPLQEREYELFKSAEMNATGYHL